MSNSSNDQTTTSRDSNSEPSSAVSVYSVSGGLITYIGVLIGVVASGTPVFPACIPAIFFGCPSGCFAGCLAGSVDDCWTEKSTELHDKEDPDEPLLGAGHKSSSAPVANAGMFGSHVQPEEIAQTGSAVRPQ